jgi:hypothetical protein
MEKEMDRLLLEKVLHEISGCTFASIDTETEPRPGIKKVTTGDKVILFASLRGVSGYEGMIKRRLEQLGISPDAYTVGPLPWGSRVGNLPLIQYKGFYYLQVVQLSEGEEKYFLFNTEIPKEQLDKFGLTKRKPQGPSCLPENKRPVIQTIALEHIKSIRLLGWEIFDKEIKERGKRNVRRTREPI